MRTSSAVFRKLACFLLLVPFVCTIAAGRTASADEPKATEPKATEAAPDMQALHKQFSERMSGVKLVGRFTVHGKEDDKPAQEEYAILRATKMDKGDYWLLQARIKYGKNDVTLPLPLEIKWAGTTPVITLDKTTIPGLGTFSARVVIDENAYAGTWTHDKVGGHLYGRISKLEESKDAK